MNGCQHRPQHGQAVSGPAAHILRRACAGRLVKAAIELMRPMLAPSEVEGVTAPAGMRVFFMAQPQCPVGVTQHPGAYRAEEPATVFGSVEDVREVAMLFVVVEIQHLVGVLADLVNSPAQ